MHRKDTKKEGDQSGTAREPKAHARKDSMSQRGSPTAPRTAMQACVPRPTTPVGFCLDQGATCGLAARSAQRDVEGTLSAHISADSGILLRARRGMHFLARR